MVTHCATSSRESVAKRFNVGPKQKGPAEQNDRAALLDCKHLHPEQHARLVCRADRKRRFPRRRRMLPVGTAISLRLPLGGTWSDGTKRTRQGLLRQSRYMATRGSRWLQAACILGVQLETEVLLEVFTADLHTQAHDRHIAASQTSATQLRLSEPKDVPMKGWCCGVVSVAVHLCC